jgi:hypothetical protein
VISRRKERNVVMSIERALGIVVFIIVILFLMRLLGVGF